MSAEDLKVLYVPGGISELKIVTLPHPLTGDNHNYLLHDKSLFELLEIDGDNPHDKNNYMRPLTKKGLPVRSSILEGSSKNGLILEDGALVVTTKFNFVFTLISYFTQEIERGKEFSRFQSSEDIFDMMQDGIPGLMELPEELIKDALTKICESMTEGGDDFYKYTEEKCLAYLKTRSDTISSSFPPSVKSSLVDPLLYPLDLAEETPKKVTDLALQRFAVCLLSSYLPTRMSNALMSQYDHRELDGYINDIKKKRAEKKMAEENLQNLNKLNANNKRAAETQEDKPAPGKKKAVPVKKALPKVSRGPLDMLFKKK